MSGLLRAGFEWLQSLKALLLLLTWLCARDEPLSLLKAFMYAEDPVAVEKGERDETGF